MFLTPYHFAKWYGVDKDFPLEYYTNAEHEVLAHNRSLKIRRFRKVFSEHFPELFCPPASLREQARLRSVAGGQKHFRGARPLTTKEKETTS